jgi:hypothetical protein
MLHASTSPDLLSTGRVLEALRDAVPVAALCIVLLATLAIATTAYLGTRGAHMRWRPAARR